MATINFTVEDHSIRVDNLIELAQGSNNFDTCAFSFDSTWDGFTLYAVMYQNPKNVFKLPLDEANTRKIPVEVLQKDGWVYIGARGEKEDTDETIATSMVVRLPVRKGAVNGNETGQEILNESQYEYLLGKVNELNEKCESLTKELEEDIGQLSEEAIDKLEEVGNYLAYTTADGGSKWTELISILRNGSSGGGSGETEVTLSSISATYTGGEVTTGTALSDLTGITVIATYSDGTTKTVTGYTLSGEILEGENTITVSYGGKTTTFTVTGIVESGGGDVTAELPTDGLVDYFDFRTCEYNNVGSGGTTLIQPTQGSGQLYTWANNAVTEQSADYGIKVIRNYMYAVDKTTTLASCGTAFTWVFKSFLTGTSNPAFADDYGTLSNAMKINYCPKYNKTDNTTARLTGEALGERLVGGGYELLFLVVDGNICKLYIENKLVKEIDGTTIEDFASWYDNLILKMLGNVTIVYASQLAIYNKALSEVEITEMKAYLETLEVA